MAQSARTDAARPPRPLLLTTVLGVQPPTWHRPRRLLWQPRRTSEGTLCRHFATSVPPNLLTPLFQEALIISYAHISVELFHLQVPQRMGSTARAKAHDSITINPRIGAPPAAQADRVYDTLHDLLEYFFASSRAAALQCCASDAEKMETKRLYHVLQKHATSAASRLPPRTLVCALSHDALDESNILIDEHTGAVTGVIDWEFHSVVPRCLAARHPGWLRYDGVHDPRFARRDQYGTAWWLETREESARLTSLFEQVRRVLLMAMSRF